MFAFVLHVAQRAKQANGWDSDLGMKHFPGEGREGEKKSMSKCWEQIVRAE